MRSAARGEQQTAGPMDQGDEGVGDENDQPTRPGVRLFEPWPERSAVIPQALRTRTSRWRAVAAVAVEGGAARVSEVDPDELATPVVVDSEAQRVLRDEAASDALAPGAAVPAGPPGSPQRGAPSPLPAGRPTSRATVRMVAPGLRGPTGTRKMLVQSFANERLELESRLTISRRWMVVAIALLALCGASMVIALRIARHRERLAVPPPATVHVP